jgi:hypothetical protein
VLTINSNKLTSPCDRDSSSNSFGSLFTVLGLLSKTSLSVPIAVGEVPCGQGVMVPIANGEVPCGRGIFLSGGQVGVLADVSVDSFTTLCFDRGWREGTRALEAMVSGILS